MHALSKGIVMSKHQAWVLRTLAAGKGYLVGNCRADRVALDTMPAGLIERATSTVRGDSVSGYAITAAGRAAL
jgi:hypothetical protein